MSSHSISLQSYAALSPSTNYLSAKHYGEMVKWVETTSPLQLDAADNTIKCEIYYKEEKLLEKPECKR